MAWAAVLIVGEIAGLTWITGINSRDGVRASLTFGDPNLAADYFICGLLVLRVRASCHADAAGGSCAARSSSPRSS